MPKIDYRGFRDLIVYRKSYDLAIEISKLTVTFPKEEKYVLVDQMRRASRSIPANIAEAWAKRKYPKSFVSTLIITHGEEMEMEVWDQAIYLGTSEYHSLSKYLLFYWQNSKHSACGRQEYLDEF